MLAEPRHAAGAPLPAEAALARRFAVSIGTVRRAVGELVAEGRLERRQGSGTYVRRADFSSLLFRFFRLEGADGKPIRPQSRILSIRRAPAPAAAARHLGLPARAAGIVISRLRLSGDTRLLAEEIWLDAKRFAALLEAPRAELEPLLYPAYERLCGVVVASVSETLSVRRAGHAPARLLQIEPGEPVIVIERAAHGVDGTVVEWRISHGRADRFQYRVDIR